MWYDVKWSVAKWITMKWTLDWMDKRGEERRGKEKERKGWGWSKGGEHWGEVENLLQIKKIKFEFVK